MVSKKEKIYYKLKEPETLINIVLINITQTKNNKKRAT